MITVTILINGQPLYTRSAFRLEGKQGEVCKYKCDDGSIITHNYNDGAVQLAHKLLDTIKELSIQDRAIKKFQLMAEKYYRMDVQNEN